MYRCFPRLQVAPFQGVVQRPRRWGDSLPRSRLASWEMGASLIGQEASCASKRKALLSFPFLLHSQRALKYFRHSPLELNCHGHICIQRLHSPQKRPMHPNALQLLPKQIPRHNVICFLEIDKTRIQRLPICLGLLDEGVVTLIECGRRRADQWCGDPCGSPPGRVRAAGAARSTS